MCHLGTTVPDLLFSQQQGSHARGHLQIRTTCEDFLTWWLQNAVDGIDHAVRSHDVSFGNGFLVDTHYIVFLREEATVVKCGASAGIW